MNAAARYGVIQNETASRERLMVMLFEAALKHMRVGAGQLEAGSKIDGAKSAIKASEIVNYLQKTLDHAQAPKLCGDLHAVYTFVCTRLLRAAGSHSAEALREAERIFAPVADAFGEAVRRAA